MAGWLPLALLATGLCNACGESAPPQAAPPSDAGQSQPATPAEPAATAPPTATTPAPAPPVEPDVESAPQAPTPDAPPPPATTVPKPAMPDLPQAPAPAPGDTQPASIAIYTLSRGKGVPAETREAYKQIRATLEQRQAGNAVTAMQSQRIGLEGETRLCVEFRDHDDAQAALADIRRLSAGVDMLNVVEEPCPSRKVDKP
jgi:hypothetical protein